MKYVVFTIVILWWTQFTPETWRNLSVRTFYIKQKDHKEHQQNYFSCIQRYYMLLFFLSVLAITPCMFKQNIHYDDGLGRRVTGESNCDSSYKRYKIEAPINRTPGGNPHRTYWFQTFLLEVLLWNEPQRLSCWFYRCRSLWFSPPVPMKKDRALYIRPGIFNLSFRFP